MSTVVLAPDFKSNFSLPQNPKVSNPDNWNGSFQGHHLIPTAVANKFDFLKALGLLMRDPKWRFTSLTDLEWFLSPSLAANQMMPLSGWLLEFLFTRPNPAPLPGLGGTPYSEPPSQRPKRPTFGRRGRS